MLVIESFARNRKVESRFSAPLRFEVILYRSNAWNELLKIEIFHEEFGIESIIRNIINPSI